MLPPMWVRRVLIAPAVPIVTLLLFMTLPLSVLVALAVSPKIPGRWRPLRLLFFALAFLAIESVAIIALAMMWLARQLGAARDKTTWLRWHDSLVKRYLHALIYVAERSFKLRIDVDAPEALAQTPVGRTRKPDQAATLLVLSRHAGPGDSFLLVHTLMQAGWRPRIVLRETLRWLPSIDVGLGRLPSYFVPIGSPMGAGMTAVSRLAGSLGPGEALVIFPEGRNFTPRRRQKSIDRLEELGRHDEADLARRMRYVLAPRPGGAIAALRAAPHAEVVFVAHTGLENLSSVVDLWRGLPMDRRVLLRPWRLPARRVPPDNADAVRWLHRWWRRIDAWILEHGEHDVIPDAVVAVVEGADEISAAPEAGVVLAEGSMGSGDVPQSGGPEAVPGTQ